MESIPRKAALGGAFGGVLLIGLLAGTTPPARALSLIDNGSFEDGDFPNDTMSCPVGSTAIANWVVTRNAVDYCGTRWAPADGSRSVALNGSAPGGISQTFNTTPGGQYEVRFFMAGDLSFPYIKNLRVEAAGSFQDYQFSTEHSWAWNMGWLENTFAFTAPTNSTTLEFYSLDAGDFGPAIDSVTVVMTGPVGVDASQLQRLTLAAPAPNPSRDGCRLTFQIPVESAVRLSVCDVQGREIRVLVDDVLPGAIHTRVWDGTTSSGRAPAGVYWIRLATPAGDVVRKAVLTQ